MTALDDLLTDLGVEVTGPLPPADGPGLPTRLTTAGVPWELSVARPVTGGPGRLRLLLEPGDPSAPTAERLERQRRDLAAWAALGPDPEAAGDLDAFLTTALGDPQTITRPAVLGLVGVAYDAGRPGAVKVYASLRAAPDARERLAARWSGLGSDGDGSLDAIATPYAASLGHGPDGPRTVLYREVDPGHEHQVVDLLDRVHGTGLMATIGRLGLGRLLWRGPVHVSIERGRATGRIGVDLCLDRAGAQGAEVVRRAASSLPPGDGPDPVTAVFAEAEASRLTLTWVGVEAPEGGEVDRLTVYGTIAATVRGHAAELRHV